jgi:acetoin utilization protein AcuB
MFVKQWMKTDPLTVTSEEYLAEAESKMHAGNFRHVPVVDSGRLVGIVTDRDLRQHVGQLARTKINCAMTEKPITTTPQATLEEAARLLLTHKVNALPVVEGDRLIGILTSSDILNAFLTSMGALEEGTVRIDLAIDSKEQTLAQAADVISREGGEILGLGRYQESWDGSTVCYLRLRAENSERLADMLGKAGYKVLGVHL